MLSPEERADIFGKKQDKMPEYEVVPISHSIDEANVLNPSISFRAFDTNIVLNLNHVEEPLLHKNTPIWLTSGNSKSPEVIYQRVDNDTINDAFKFYEDPNNMAGIAVEQDMHANLRFMGFIRDAFVIKPVPQGVINTWNDYFKNDIKSRITRSITRPFVSDLHFVIKRSPSDEGFFVPNVDIKNITEELKLKRRSSFPDRPQIIYPRLLIFTDYGLEYTSEREIRFYRLLVYLSAFWNAVNLKFSQFENPKIKFRIVGIVVGMNKWASPYIYEKRVHESIVNTEALKSFGYWVKNKNPPIDREEWDIAVTQTTSKFCGDWTCPQANILGIAYMQGKCNDWYPYSTMTALVHDNLDFTGVLIATHEIGHIFGAQHDNTLPKCVDDGYIMASFAQPHENNNHWSTCSVDSINKHLRSVMDHCYNKPNAASVNESVPAVLPGDYISPDEQCRSQGWDWSCKVTRGICSGLKCYTEDIFGTSIFAFCHNSGVPVDGTICDDDHHCQLGSCVSKKS
ncbi:hypothetical protein HCN44_003726 [Aphidius gifuensis]|uniref:Peptidase M12B domain-containing protein n=1 Tax=Aphidius gifuensis TaxID=684658 RepID=A0A834XKF2_APHGI|nr:hypothetical protein HCN44_003726 [Aphidius gifuensis]